MELIKSKFFLIYLLVIMKNFVPNLRKKCYTEGKEKLSELEKYILGLVEEDNDFSKDIGKDLDIVIDYVNEAGEVTRGTNFGEAYDKEWALTDQGRREGIEIGKKSIITNMYKNNISIEEISKITNVDIKEVKQILKKEDNK